jgi:hypothetical protein
MNNTWGRYDLYLFLLERVRGADGSDFQPTTSPAFEVLQSHVSYLGPAHGISYTLSHLTRRTHPYSYLAVSLASKLGGGFN